MSVTVQQIKEFGSKKQPHKFVDLPAMKKPNIKQVAAPGVYEDKDSDLFPPDRYQIEQANSEAQQVAEFGCQIFIFIALLVGFVFIGILLTSGKLPL